MKKPEKQPEAIVLELDERLEFGAVVVDSGDLPALSYLEEVQCHCLPGVNTSC
jgi:hypothetical protein